MGVESAAPGVIKRLVWLEKNYWTPRVASAKHHPRARTSPPDQPASRAGQSSRRYGSHMRLKRSRNNIEVVSRRVATMISGVTRRPVKVQQLPFPLLLMSTKREFHIISAEDNIACHASIEA